MSTRKALGKGLGALIPGAEAGTSVREPRTIPIERIVPNRHQPRMGFNEEAIEKLAESIREQGILEPLIVRPASTPDADYELVAGERRWRAAMKAGLERVPVVVKDLSDREALEIALTENLQREDLNPVEEANGYRILQDEFKMTQEEIAKRVGVDRSTVSNALRLLKLEDYILKDLAEGKLTAGHARALLAVEGEARQILWKEIISKNLTVRQAELLSQKPALKPGRPIAKIDAKAVQRSREFEDALKNMEERLSKALGGKVKITLFGRGGKIEIKFSTREELEGIFDRILGE